jgi:hypothetical protein
MNMQKAISQTNKNTSFNTKMVLIYPGDREITLCFACF